jgi:hypothetical protein
MRILVIFLFTVLLSSNSYSADWGYLKSYTEGTLYYDRLNISKYKKNGDINIKFNIRYDLKEPSFISSGTVWNSTTYTLILACESSMYSIGNRKYFSGRGATGSIVEKKDGYDDWKSFGLATVGGHEAYELEKFCKR